MQAVNFSGKQESLNWINEFQPKQILDAGSGVGTYGALLKQFATYPISTLQSLDINPDLVEKYGLEFNYHWIYIADLRIWQRFAYDLVIFGDIFDDMTKDEAMMVWDKCSKEAKHALISVSNNIWDPKDVITSFNGITRYQKFDKLSIYWAEFNASR
jgi:hypothetical protein